jgi:hypothetical protein
MGYDNDFNFSDKQSVALSSGSSAVSTNVNYNAASPKDAFGVAKALEIGGSYFNVNVTTALAGAGATVRCQLVTKAADASLSSGATVVAEVLLPATAAIGTVKSIMLAPHTERLAYLGVLFTAAGGTTSAGNVNAWLGPPAQNADD